MVRESISLVLTGGGPLGVAFQAGALIALQDIFSAPFIQQVQTVVGSSAGAVTGAFVAMGLAPETVLKSMSGRFPREIEHFDPILLLDLERRQVPNLLTAGWRSLRLIISDIRKDAAGLSPEARHRRYRTYLSRIEEFLNVIPKGWFRLQSLEAFLCKVLSDRRGRLYRFDHLRRDLFVCATDLSDGCPVLFGKRRFQPNLESMPFFSRHRCISGSSLAHAIVSSSAIPFVFLPYVRDGAILADGETRNTTALSVALKLGGSRFLILINPLSPLRGISPDCQTSEFTLQTLLTALEGNVAANLRVALGIREEMQASRGDPFDFLYFSPSPEEMQRMTGSSLVELFSYRPTHALAGYRAVFQQAIDPRGRLRAALGRHGHEMNLDLAAMRFRLMELHQRDRDELEDLLVKPKNELPSLPNLPT